MFSFPSNNWQTPISHSSYMNDTMFSNNVEKIEYQWYEQPLDRGSIKYFDEIHPSISEVELRRNRVYVMNKKTKYQKVLDNSKAIGSFGKTKQKKQIWLPLNEIGRHLNKNTLPNNMVHNPEELDSHNWNQVNSPKSSKKKPLRRFFDDYIELPNPHKLKARWAYCLSLNHPKDVKWIIQRIAENIYAKYCEKQPYSSIDSFLMPEQPKGSWGYYFRESRHELKNKSGQILEMESDGEYEIYNHWNAEYPIEEGQEKSQISPVSSKQSPVSKHEPEVEIVKEKKETHKIFEKPKVKKPQSKNPFARFKSQFGSSSSDSDKSSDNEDDDYVPEKAPVQVPKVQPKTSTYAQKFEDTYINWEPAYYCCKCGKRNSHYLTCECGDKKHGSKNSSEISDYESQDLSDSWKEIEIDFEKACWDKMVKKPSHTKSKPRSNSIIRQTRTKNSRIVEAQSGWVSDDD